MRLELIGALKRRRSVTIGNVIEQRAGGEKCCETLFFARVYRQSKRS